MGRQRIGKVGWRELWWRIGLSFGLGCFSLFGWYDSFSNGGMFSFIVEYFFVGLGVVSVLLGAFVLGHLKDVLEYDGKCLYIVDIRYFRRLIDKCIELKDITEILLFGRREILVTIKYGEKQAYIRCQKDDEVYEFLKELAVNLNVLKQGEQTLEHSLILTLLKLGIICGIGWIYWEDILICSFFIGMFALRCWFMVLGVVLFIILCKVLAKHEKV